jgi:hypothetical protein
MHGGPEEPDYWRGYAIAGIAIAVILVAEIVVSAFVS